MNSQKKSKDDIFLLFGISFYISNLINFCFNFVIKVNAFDKKIKRISFGLPSRYTVYVMINFLWLDALFYKA